MTTKMRRGLTWTLVLCAAMAVSVTAIASAAKPTVVRAGNVILTLNGGVSPKKLPKNKLAPIALNVSGSIATVDGSQPPVAKTVTIDFDKNGTVNAKGLPVCRSGQLQARDTGDAKAACPKAIVGKGRTTVRVAFPDQAPFNASGPLVLFNGGVKGGTTTMFIHAYVNVPTPTALVTTVKITKIRKGRFGTRADAEDPDDRRRQRCADQVQPHREPQIHLQGRDGRATCSPSAPTDASTPTPSPPSKTERGSPATSCGPARPASRTGPLRRELRSPLSPGMRSRSHRRRRRSGC